MHADASNEIAVVSPKIEALAAAVRRFGCSVTALSLP